VELLEAAALKGVANDHDVRWVRAHELVEDAKEKTTFLVQVERGVFGRCAGEGAGGREEACRVSEVQVRLTFKRCGVRGGVAAGR
jgi:hypothetical protein